MAEQGNKQTIQTTYEEELSYAKMRLTDLENFIYQLNPEPKTNGSKEEAELSEKLCFAATWERTAKEFHWIAIKIEEINNKLHKIILG